MHPTTVGRGAMVGFCALALAAASGCAGHSQTLNTLWQAPRRPVVWPLPPLPPRIRYEGAVTGETISRYAGRGAWSFLNVLAGRPHIGLQTPHGIARKGDLLAVADSARAQVLLLDLRRGRCRVVESAGKERLRCPIGVAFGADGGCFVSDSVLAKVFRFSPSGRLVGEVGHGFIRPTGVAYDAERRRLYVVDTGAHSVSVFEERGGALSLLRRLGDRGEESGAFNFPTHIALDAQGRVYVGDSLNFRVQTFDPAGTPLGAFGRAGDGTGDFAKLKGVAVDGAGRIYTVDSLYDVVQMFDDKGRLLLSFGGSGGGDAELWLPTGICVDGRGLIFVSDSGNSRIQVYSYVEQGS